MSYFRAKLAMEISRRVYFVAKNTKINQKQKDHLSQGIDKSEIPGLKSSKKKKKRDDEKIVPLSFSMSRLVKTVEKNIVICHW